MTCVRYLQCNKKKTWFTTRQHFVEIMARYKEPSIDGWCTWQLVQGTLYPTLFFIGDVLAKKIVTLSMLKVDNASSRCIVQLWPTMAKMNCGSMSVLCDLTLRVRYEESQSVIRSRFNYILLIHMYIPSIRVCYWQCQRSNRLFW